MIYQIYPLSFCDSNGDGMGDLAGITSRLDHVASLGVDAIWLSPFFPSPMKDFGYDVSDYCGVDRRFGTLADFDALLARAHDLGLKVIIDQVFSHTSDRHPWFIESAAAPEGPKAAWYVWADAKADGSPPNNWLASFGGPSWTWGAKRRQYFLHNFLAAQPDLNFWNEDVQAALLASARFWLDRGVDGFRLDVVNYYVHDAKLRDNPPAEGLRPRARPSLFQSHIFDRSRPETLAFVARLRALSDERPGRMLVGEVVDDPALPRQIEYVSGPDRLHTAYSFFLLTAREASPALFVEATRAWEGAAGWPSWSLGNHDVERFPSRLAGGDPRLARALLAALMFLKGTIFLYQGEELGLPQAKVPFEALKDPFAIAAFTGGAGRDGARTPMPWTSAGPSAGFSASEDKTWLPLDPAHRPLAADAQEADPASLLHFTRKLLALRRANTALRLGEARVLEAPAGVLALERGLGEERLLCLVNLSDLEAEYACARPLASLENFLGGRIEGSGAVRLAPFSALLAALG
ncbi:MAG: alpha-amylase family glycosyl hydrolase [Caulobacteraceae bacterium]